MVLKNVVLLAQNSRLAFSKLWFCIFYMDSKAIVSEYHGFFKTIESKLGLNSESSHESTQVNIQRIIWKGKQKLIESSSFLPLNRPAHYSRVDWAEPSYIPKRTQRVQGWVFLLRHPSLHFEFWLMIHPIPLHLPLPSMDRELLPTVYQ